MRELKLRAWDKTENKMIVACWKDNDVFDPTYYTPTVHFDGSVVIYMGDDGGKNGLWEHEVAHGDRFILMQFTGLHDKNGKEIYEGDILDVDTGNRIVKVIWFEPQGCFDTEVIKIIDKTWPYFAALQNNQWPYRCEIIGNIYENPELLEAK